MRVWFVALLLVPMAGCLDGEAAEAPQEPAPEPTARLDGVTVEVPSASEPGTGAGGFRFTVAGEPGAHLVVHHPFPEARDEVEYEYEWTLEVGASGGHAFWTDLTPTIREGDGFRMVRFFPFDTERIRTFEDGLSLSSEGSAAMSCGCEIDGLMMAAAADGPWRLEVTVRWGEGNLTGPAFVSHGRDATFRTGAESVLPVQGGAGRLELQATVSEPGWTHVELLGHRLQPDAVRDASFRLPNGFEAGGLGHQTGYHIPVLLGGSARHSGMVDYAGTPRGTPGELSAEVTFVEASVEMDLAWMHLPGATVPDGLRGDGYAGSNWPFEDPLPDG